MVLEGANGPLCPIAAMHVRRDKLEGGLPLEGDSVFVGRAGFFIQDLEINGETPGCQTGHDCVVGGNSMSIALGLEGLLEDEVAIGVKQGNHHILVTGTRPDRKAAGVISKELAQWMVMTKTWLEGVAMGGGGHTSGDGVGCLGFLDLTFWHCWARWPIIVSSESGQYLAALEYVRPLKVSQLPTLIASSHVCLTGKPRQA